jgi:hypothetical protein
VAVEAFVGLWGSGKTLALTERCRDKELEGYRVASNFGYVGSQHLDTLDDLLQFLRTKDPRERVYLAIDEAGMWFPAREFSKWPPALNVLVQQGRKLGIEMGYTSQRFEFVDSNLRRVTDTVTRCTGWGSKRLTPKGFKPASYRPLLFLRSTYLALEFESAKAKPTRWRFLRFDPEVAALYDTMHIIAAAQRTLGMQLGDLQGAT